MSFPAITNIYFQKIKAEWGRWLIHIIPSPISLHIYLHVKIQNFQLNVLMNKCKIL